MEKVKSEDRLLESIIAGAQKVINGKDELNKTEGSMAAWKN